AVKFVKLLFLYEQWHMFSHLSHGLQQVLSAELELTLLEAVAPLISPRKFQRPNSKDGITFLCGICQCIKHAFDTLIIVNQVYHFVVNTTLAYNVFYLCVQDIQPDGDLVVDIILFLWSKCKPLFQKLHSIMGEEQVQSDKIRRALHFSISHVYFLLTFIC
uniref:Uncharacterized protein n=1 Tax=Denticeps clupeoides TaxID=299321 RepID=A0AAY4EVZ6_9TELE